MQFIDTGQGSGYSLSATFPLARDCVIIPLRMVLPSLLGVARAVFMETSKGKGVFYCTDFGLAA